MNKITKITIFCLILSNISFSECNWSNIKKNNDNTYTYSEELHLCVGELVRDNKNKDEQISNLTKSISLKDLALQTSDKRVEMWMDTSLKLEDRVNKVDSMQKTNNFLFFGAGILTTILAGFMTARILGK